MKHTFKRILALIDARDVFVFIGITLLFGGITCKFDVFSAMIVVGTIIIIKGLTKWV